MIELMEENYPRGQKLLDQESLEKLPELTDTEEERLDAKALVKFFSIDRDLVWYAAYSGVEFTFSQYPIQYKGSFASCPGRTSSRMTLSLFVVV